jgi:hypothetical protein
MELKSPSSKLKLIIFFLLPSLFLVVILTLALREFVREKIVLPLAYFWSLLLLLFSSTPQVVFWGIFILISIFIIIKTLLAGKDKVVVPIEPKEDSLAPGRDHIYHWTIQVQLAVHGNLYFRDRVMRSLERLVMGVIAYQERLTFKEVEYALAHRSLEVPPDIARLFDYQPEIVSSPGDGKFVQLMKVWYSRIKSEFGRLILKKESPNEYQKLEEIIDYLETQLEIKHGG